MTTTTQSKEPKKIYRLRGVPSPKAKNKNVWANYELCAAGGIHSTDLVGILTKRGLKPVRYITHDSGFVRRLWGKDAYDFCVEWKRKKEEAKAAPPPAPEPTPAPVDHKDTYIPTTAPSTPQLVPFRLNSKDMELHVKIDKLQATVDSLIAALGGITEVATGNGYDDERKGARQ